MLVFEVIGVNPTNPNTISFPTKIPNEFDHVFRVPIPQINEVQTPTVPWRTNFLPSYGGFSLNLIPSTPNERSQCNLYIVNHLLREGETLQPIVCNREQYTLDELDPATPY